MDEAARVLESLSRTGGDPVSVLLPTLLKAEDDVVIVLDDCHVLETPPLLRLLESLVGRGDSGPRIVLSTRVDPPISLAKPRLSGTLLELRQKDLRFRIQEGVDLLRGSLDFPLPEELLGRLEERTEGWAAGLRMAAIALQRAEDPRAAAEDFAGSNELLVDYLLEEVVGGQEKELQEFLMETSLLPRFNPDACIAVTGDPKARDRLRAVDEANLFLVSLDHRQQWFRYHHLFAELLTFRLTETRPEKVEGLRERASRWFEARGDVQEALAQAWEMRDPRRLVELLDEHGYPILARSEFASFSRWLGGVPDPLTQPFPMFLAALAWFRAQTERAPDLEELLGALEAAVERGPPGYPPERLEEARLHLAALRPFSLRISNWFQESIEAGEAALVELPPGAVTMRGVLEFNMGAVHLRLANMEPARHYLERAFESCRKGTVPYLTLASLGHLGAVATQTEGLPRARSRLESALAYARDRELTRVPAYAILLYQLAQVHYLAHELDQARAYLLQGLELTGDERETDIHANVLIHLARVEGARGETGVAEEHLNTASALAFRFNVKPFATTFDVERARLAELGTGRLQSPEEAPPSAEAGASWSSWLEAETVLQLQHCLRLGRFPETQYLADRLRAESEPRLRGVALCVAEVARAALEREAGKRRKILSSTLSLAAARCYIMPLVQGGPPIRSLLESALKYPLPPQAQSFVRDRVLPWMPEREESPGSLPEQGGDWNLTDRELDVLGLLARGMTNQGMARELFLSENTVKTHLKRVFAKLDVANRTEAVERARRLGLIRTEDPQ